MTRIPNGAQVTGTYLGVPFTGRVYSSRLVLGEPVYTVDFEPAIDFHGSRRICCMVDPAQAACSIQEVPSCQPA